MTLPLRPEKRLPAVSKRNRANRTHSIFENKQLILNILKIFQFSFFNFQLKQHLLFQSHRFF